MVIIFICGSLKDCLMKRLILLLHLIMCYYGTKTKVEFSRRCLRQEKITYDHGKTVKFTLFMR